MRQDYKDKWVEKLESGEYHQGQGRLKRDKKIYETKRDGKIVDTYCCLGVLGVCIMETNPEEFKTLPGIASLTKEAMEEADLSWSVMATLTAMNDGMRTNQSIFPFQCDIAQSSEFFELDEIFENRFRIHSFKEIAEIIKQIT